VPVQGRPLNFATTRRLWKVRHPSFLCTLPGLWLLLVSVGTVGAATRPGVPVSPDIAPATSQVPALLAESPSGVTLESGTAPVAPVAPVALAELALAGSQVFESSPILAGGIAYERLPRQEFTLGVNAFYIDSFRRTGKTRMPLELTWHRYWGGPTVRSPFSYRVGLRSDFQPPLGMVPLEVFGRGEWASSLGYYQPSLGLELGISTYTLFNPTPRDIPDSSYQSEAESMSPVYVSWCAAPIRFAYKRWSLSVLEIHLGTLLPNALQIARLEVGLLNFGMGY